MFTKHLRISILIIILAMIAGCSSEYRIETSSVEEINNKVAHFHFFKTGGHGIRLLIPISYSSHQFKVGRSEMVAMTLIKNYNKVLRISSVRIYSTRNYSQNEHLRLMGITASDNVTGKYYLEIFNSQPNPHNKPHPPDFIIADKQYWLHIYLRPRSTFVAVKDAVNDMNKVPFADWIEINKKWPFTEEEYEKIFWPETEIIR